jgi:hypothetical protein
VDKHDSSAESYIPSLGWKAGICIYETFVHLRGSVEIKTQGQRWYLRTFLVPPLKMGKAEATNLWIK